MLKKLKQVKGKVTLNINDTIYEFDIQEGIMRLFKVLLTFALIIAGITGFMSNAWLTTTVLGLLFGLGVIALIAASLPEVVLPFMLGKPKKNENTETAP